jgi:hypothetical protein
MTPERVAPVGMFSGSDEAELVSVRVRNREFSRAIGRSKSGSTTATRSLSSTQSASGSSTVKLNRAPRPSASITAKVAPPDDLKCA